MFWAWSRVPSGPHSLLFTLVSEETPTVLHGPFCVDCDITGTRMLLLSVKKLGHEVSVLPMAFMGAQGPLPFIRCLSTKLWVECKVSKILKGKVSNKSLVVLVGSSLWKEGQVSWTLGLPKSCWRLRQVLWLHCYCFFLYTSTYFHPRFSWMARVVFRVGTERVHVLGHDVFSYFCLLFIFLVTRFHCLSPRYQETKTRQIFPSFLPRHISPQRKRVRKV